MSTLHELQEWDDMYLPCVTHVTQGLDYDWVLCWVVSLYSHFTDSDITVWVPIEV